MTRMQKRWTRLGLGAALVGTALAAGCSDSTAPQEMETAAAPAAPEGQARPSASALQPGEGEGGLGGEGEGGEGGVNVALAASDPVVYRSALAVTEAHILAARDAYRAGETAAAAEMFAHPVSEVLFEMEEVLRAQGVEPFYGLLTDASEAALANAPASQIDAHARAIIGTLGAAAGKAPQSDLGEGRIAAGVVADQIARAADMYRGALASGRYEPYLDGYGFYRAARATFETEREAIRRAVPEAAGQIETALDLLARAYPGAGRQATLDADPGALAVANANVQLALD